jgi:hypothetical protein
MPERAPMIAAMAPSSRAIRVPEGAWEEGAFAACHPVDTGFWPITLQEAIDHQLAPDCLDRIDDARIGGW